MTSPKRPDDISTWPNHARTRLEIIVEYFSKWVVVQHIELFTIFMFAQINDDQTITLGFEGLWGENYQARFPDSDGFQNRKTYA